MRCAYAHERQHVPRMRSILGRMYLTRRRMTWVLFVTINATFGEIYNRQGQARRLSMRSFGWDVRLHLDVRSILFRWVWSPSRDENRWTREHYQLHTGIWREMKTKISNWCIVLLVLYDGKIVWNVIRSVFCNVEEQYCYLLYNLNGDGKPDCIDIESLLALLIYKLQR
jgi:hypothetical protein